MTHPAGIMFNLPEDDFGLFSNRSLYRAGIDGTMWKSVEHYYQAQKFTDHNLRYQVQLAATPLEAARIGQNRANPLRPDWEAVKVAVMKKALTAKVMQNHPVREALLGTGDAQLVYQAAGDLFWGNGGNDGGQNMLGRLLMEIRAELTPNGPFDELRDAHLPLWMQCPDLKRYSMGWRMGYGEEVVWRFGLWWAGISEEGKQKYRLQYPEPKGWIGWYDNKHEEELDEDDEDDDETI